jgi:hypothetical protein
MKLSEIKTKTQFYKIANDWYQRTKNLYNIYMDSSQSTKRRSNALFLYFIMRNRMQKIVDISIKIDAPIPLINKVKSACIIAEGKEPIIIR